jgi:hypothetical protein
MSIPGAAERESAMAARKLDEARDLPSYHYLLTCYVYESLATYTSLATTERRVCCSPSVP